MSSSRSSEPSLVLSRLLADGERVKVPLDSLDKPGILWEMSSLLARVTGSPERENEIHDAVVARERVLSTGIGDGVALPHGKCAALPSLALVAGRTREPVPFEALDGEPVHLVFLLVGPPSAAGLHVRILSRISRLLRDEGLRDRLAGAASAAEFRELLREAEGT